MEPSGRAPLAEFARRFLVVAVPVEDVFVGEGVRATPFLADNVVDFPQIPVAEQQLALWAASPLSPEQARFFPPVRG